MLASFEARLLNEIRLIEDRINGLRDEQQALRRQIARARAQRTGMQEVTRKNSGYRVLAENSVIEMLERAKKACTTKQLYRNALESNYELKENTFRNYLHRMKKKGLIETAGHVGVWQLTSKK